MREWCGGPVVARPCRGRHGDVRERRLAGQGSNGRGARGSRGAWHVLWWSGVPRAGVCWPGWLRTVRARKLLDSGTACRTPATAGRGGGQEQGGRAGVPQGGGWQLQDVLVAGFGAGLAKWPGWWPCPWHGYLGLGFRVWGCWVCVQKVQGVRGEVLDMLVWQVGMWMMWYLNKWVRCHFYYVALCGTIRV